MPSSAFSVSLNLFLEINDNFRRRLDLTIVLIAL